MNNFGEAIVPSDNLVKKAVEIVKGPCKILSAMTTNTIYMHIIYVNTIFEKYNTEYLCTEVVTQHYE